MRGASITVSGKVQGVWFRKYTCDKAVELGLKGTVENLSNGNVLIHTTGTDAQIESLIDWCWQGSPESDVSGVDVKDVPCSEYTDFRILA